MSGSLSISDHTLVMESLKLSPRVKEFKEENYWNSLTLGPSLGDSITRVRPEIERLIDIFAVTPFSSNLALAWTVVSLPVSILEAKD